VYLQVRRNILIPVLVSGIDEIEFFPITCTYAMTNHNLIIINLNSAANERIDHENTK